MSDHHALHVAVRDAAHAVLAERRSALADAGLRANVELERHFEEGRESWSEIRIDLWRQNAFVDVLETFVVQDGAPVATLEKLRLWLAEGLDAVLREQGGG
jgi:hypothetical protein